LEGWNFLTNHGRVLLCMAHDPGVRLRDIAARVGITERSAYGIVTGLAAAGYVVKEKDGRRSRYQIQAHMPLPEPASQLSTSQTPSISRNLLLVSNCECKLRADTGISRRRRRRCPGGHPGGSRP
jgi:DNA-binding transcriptional regulator PaaX